MKGVVYVHCQCGKLHVKFNATEHVFPKLFHEPYLVVSDSVFDKSVLSQEQECTYIISRVCISSWAQVGSFCNFVKV